MPLVEGTLEPLEARTDPQTYQRLRDIVVLFTMAESYQFLKDSLDRTPREAAETIGWAILELTRAVQAGSAGDGAPPARS